MSLLFWNQVLKYQLNLNLSELFLLFVYLRKLWYFSFLFVIIFSLPEFSFQYLILSFYVVRTILVLLRVIILKVNIDKKKL
jgi:hypothetical protein